MIQKYILTLTNYLMSWRRSVIILAYHTIQLTIVSHYQPRRTLLFCLLRRDVQCAYNSTAIVLTAVAIHVFMHVTFSGRLQLFGPFRCDCNPKRAFST